MKECSTYKYLFEAGSPSDFAQWLGFPTMELAENHANTMNKHLDQFRPSEWNMDYWKNKPLPWVARIRL